MRPDLSDWIYRQLKKGRNLYDLKKEMEAKGGLDDYSYERDRSIQDAVEKLCKEDKAFAFWWHVREHQDIYLAAGIIVLLTIIVFFSRFGA